MQSVYISKAVGTQCYDYTGEVFLQTRTKCKVCYLKQLTNRLIIPAGLAHEEP